MITITNPTDEMKSLAFKIEGMPGYYYQDQSGSVCRIEFKTTRAINFAEEKQKCSIIRNIVLKYFSIELLELVGKSRKRTLVIARQIFLYLASSYTILGTVDIGKYVNRDHSTVIYSRTKLPDLMQFDKVIKNHVEQIENIINAKLNNSYERKRTFQQYSTNGSRTATISGRTKRSSRRRIHRQPNRFCQTD